MPETLTAICTRCVRKTARAAELTKVTCPRCGAEASEVYPMLCGCLEGICTACTRPDAHLSFMVTGACEVHGR